MNACYEDPAVDSKLSPNSFVISKIANINSPSICPISSVCSVRNFDARSVLCTKLVAPYVIRNFDSGSVLRIKWVARIGALGCWHVLVPSRENVGLAERGWHVLEEGIYKLGVLAEYGLGVVARFSEMNVVEDFLFNSCIQRRGDHWSGSRKSSPVTVRRPGNHRGR